MLGNPELLLLDEPTNRLDPAGIHEVRTLVRDLSRRRGVTVFLSSHLLSEVEQVATHLAIVSRGQLKFEGTREELQTRGRQTAIRSSAKGRPNSVMVPWSGRWRPKQHPNGGRFSSSVRSQKPVHTLRRHGQTEPADGRRGSVRFPNLLDANRNHS